MDAGRTLHADCDRKVVSICEILGAYFVDVLFNHVWASAVAGRKAGTPVADADIKVVVRADVAAPAVGDEFEEARALSESRSSHGF